ncbi:LacI family DNA-binding transcriptional regulator [Acidothermaceae bacterium B102]|nr:LacI family DNA-binding transcriptional regulator [Acidothermaceae bacterium B102]
MAERATLDSVAAHARVSRQTVSNALNAPHLLHPDTLARVQSAIEATNYRPSRAARSLRTSRSQLIGVGLPAAGDGVNGYVLDRFLHGLTEASGSAGYHVLLFSAGGDEQEIEAYDDILATQSLDAFVLTSTHHGDRRTAWLAERDLPFVTFGRPWGTSAGHSWVDVDGAAGTHEATTNLIAAGHRRIAFIGWPDGSGVGDDRRSGWQSAMAAADLPTDGLLVQDQDGAESGRVAMASLLTASDPATAVVCASDSLALGVYDALRQVDGSPSSRAAVPIVGFDDTPVAAALGISSLAQPLVAAAQECVRLLLDLLEPGPDTADQPAHVLLAPRLVVRASGAGPMTSPTDRPAVHVGQPITNEEGETQ